MQGRKLLVLFFATCSSFVLSAPRSTKTSTHYDQKQTGEYNIQLHLKDFQIIALLGQDSLDSLAGDYDYDYDYSDFTIKPSTSSSTTTTTTTTTKKPDTQNSTSNSTPSSLLIPPSSTSKPDEPLLKPQKPMELFELLTLPPPEKPGSPSQLSGQIPVVVQDFSLPTLTIIRKDPVAAEEDKIDGSQAGVNVAIMNTDETTQESVEQENLGEIVQYRRCPQGWSRDKRGRCRKLRRPQFPLGISRLATNLASRLRQPPSLQRSESTPEKLSHT